VAAHCRHPALSRITSCNPNNETSPFFDPTCAPVKPVARLQIVKQREYKKQCYGGHPDALGLNNNWGSPGGPDINSDVYGKGVGPQIDGGRNGGNEDDYDDYGTDYSNAQGSSSSSYHSRGRGPSSRDSTVCDTTPWGSWTTCSQTCDGPSSQSRSRCRGAPLAPPPTRSYPNPTGAKIANCNANRLEKRVRQGPRCLSSSRTRSAATCPSAKGTKAASTLSSQRMN
jgi:hypothetical protein